MIEPNFIDDVDCGSFFDHIDDLLNFPADETATADGNFPAPVDAVSSESPKTLPSSDSEPVFPVDAATADLSAELSVPYEDIVQLEWLSNFVEDSFSGGSLTMKKVEPSSYVTTITTTTTPKEDLSNGQYQISSPNSVLESSSSCSGEKTAPRSPELIHVPVPCARAARSKRPRPATFNPHHHPVMQLISPASSVGDNTQPHNATYNNNNKASSDSENYAESPPLIKIPRQQASGDHKKKNKIKVPSSQLSDAPSPQAVRKCMHCEITKTPQWRAGPMGPKTLCNACGVRYKSGRLFPEYRPAASPTFCPAVHSNSHKKVLEMRNMITKKCGDAAVASPELIPNTDSSISMEYMCGEEME